MENIEILEIENPLTQSVQEFVIIDRGNGEFTSILKSEYDAQVEHLTEIPTPDEA